MIIHFKELTNKREFREIVLYGIFGATSTVLDVGLFWLFSSVFGFQYLLANAIAWVLAMVYSFLVNKCFVFGSKSFKRNVWIREATEFFSARGFACGIDMGGMFLFVSVLEINKNISKLFVSLVVIIINYVLSKFWIFKK